MTRAIRLAACLVLLAALSAWPVQAKGDVTRISLQMAGMARPVEIVEPGLLSGFDPWRGLFVNWSRGPVPAPPDVSRTYQVLFYGESGSPTAPIYAVQYALASATAPGYIYLPGRGDQWYQTNIGTIMRDDADGHWYLASDNWDAIALQALQRAGAAPPAGQRAAAGAVMAPKVPAPAAPAAAPLTLPVTGAGPVAVVLLLVAGAMMLAAPALVKSRRG